MKRPRLAAFLLSLAMIFSTVSAFASSSLLIPRQRTGQAAFSDTRGTWCAGCVQTCYETGILNGKSADTFDPDGTLTCGEIMAVAARFSDLLAGGDGQFEPAGSEEDWFSPYFNALNDLVWGGSEYNTRLDDILWYLADTPYDSCSRYTFVALMSAILPDDALPAVNRISVLPDVESSETEILNFYNAGILTGSDKYGTFNGYDSLTRGQAAAMLARLIDPAQRVKFSPATYSFSREILGLAPETAVLTVDGFSVTAETYAYALYNAISDYELENSYAYYDKYSEYLDEYYQDENYYAYDTFEDFLLAEYGIDASTECRTQWNVPDKAGLTPAQEVRSTALDNIRQLAMLFNHAAEYPLTTAQKAAVPQEVSDRGNLYFGFTSAFASQSVTADFLSSNISRKYVSSSAELNDSLADNGLFYGRYITIYYDTSKRIDSGYSYATHTRSEALQLAQTVRQQAASHLSDSDYFSYLAWKYSDEYETDASLQYVSDLSDEQQAALKSLKVGALSSVLDVEDDQYFSDDTSVAESGSCRIYLKDNALTDNEVVEYIGSAPAQIQLADWALDSTVTTSAAYDGIQIASAAERSENLTFSPNC